MKKREYGLLGCPLSHSLSPLIHTELLKLKGIEGTYRLYEVAQGELQERFAAELSGLDGFNVTIPYKTAILPFLSGCSERAALYGAVNTVKITDGKACGYNTDCIGFLRSLTLAGMALQGRVLICGCGGVARMFAFESALAGAEVTFGIRKESTMKAEALQKELKEKCGVESGLVLLNEAEGAYDLIINATPVGMFPHTQECPVTDEVLQSAGAVFDAIYNPAQTLLLKKAASYGKQVQNGLPMLVIQAAAAEEIWNGITFSEGELAQVIALTEKELKHE